MSVGSGIAGGHHQRNGQRQTVGLNDPLPWASDELERVRRDADQAEIARIEERLKVLRCRMRRAQK